VNKQERGDKYILLEKPYSNHPGDSHLTMVLARWHNKFVTWGYNMQDQGFFWGHYFQESELEKALDDFNKRGLIQ